jgi:hypothetical protein
LTPYRYALPRSTEAKLSRLRVTATGRKRRTGPPKGERCVARLPGGSRTIRSLDQVYAVEDLPARPPLASGEQQTVRATGTAEFVAGLEREQLIPRRGSASQAD